jgi:peroxiredoxin-like protein
MSDITVRAKLSYSAAESAGEIAMRSGTYAFSIPEDMGGKGKGTNPEELLLSAVAGCFTLTLAIVLRIQKLPYTDLQVGAEGLVTGVPRDLKYQRVTVSPIIAGADAARRGDYLAAVEKAHERCFIGQALKGNVEYVVGEMTLS